MIKIQHGKYTKEKKGCKGVNKLNFLPTLGDRGFGLGDDFVDDAVGLGFRGIHEEVALDVFFDLRERLAGIFGEQLI